jgi:hypothetical protein
MNKFLIPNIFIRQILTKKKKKKRKKKLYGVAHKGFLSKVYY